MEGDRRFAIVAFSLRFGQEQISRFCIGILAAGYLALLTGQGIWVAATRSSPIIWKLFYLEYLLYPWAFFPFS